ncbi:FxSxx-COOH system tetratricopeptide repeat protein [Streptomyces cinnamoneus]|uniref:FxSxx-COOH system tetratricopeptide repeat protein n=1 Tax=Streptomyces cinnamoneus TaxID=53446 RepID=UPI0033C8BAB9
MARAARLSAASSAPDLPGGATERRDWLPLVGAAEKKATKGRDDPHRMQVAQSGTASACLGSNANSGIQRIDNLNMVQRRAPQEPAPWPHAVGVPPSRAQSFQHRAEAEELRAALDQGGTAVVGQVLTGMGGVGKTQLAAAYARTAWDEGKLDVLVWVTASTRQAIVDQYVKAGRALCRGDPDDADEAAHTFLAWLLPRAGGRTCRWLVVLDDVSDPDDMRDLWPPASPHGRTLATTRRRDAALTGDDRRMVEVGLFTEAEAVAHLATSLSARSRTAPAAELAALARELGRLPLALSQATAYLADSGLSVAAYRTLLAENSTRLADTAPDRLPDDQAVPLAAVWTLSLERANALHPAGLAGPMLQLAAHLDPNGIPHTVLTSPPTRAYLTAHHTPNSTAPQARRWWPRKRGRPPAPAPATPEEANGALRALHRLSLIDHTPDTPHHAVSVHQLIQRTTRDTLTPDQHHEIARTCADALCDAWPDPELDTALAQALRANTAALTTCAEPALYRPDAHPVLFRTGRSLGKSGQAAAARDYYQYLNDTTTARLGPDHPDTQTTRHHLAHWRGKAGDEAGAVTALAELLPDLVRVLGPDHPRTRTTRHNLAHWRGEAGDEAGAVTALAELLPDRIRVLGPDHPDTLTTRHDIAHWRGEAGDEAGAVTAFAELLPDRIRVLGPDHPDTLTTRHNLAHWRGEAGDEAGAVTAFAELLPDRIRVLGPDHPNTLSTRHHLAWWRGEAGDEAGAVTALAELLPDQIRMLGPDHLYTLTTRHNLAWWRGEAGDEAGAVTAYAELLPDLIRMLGPDHPYTLTTRHNLAQWRGEAGDEAGAVTAYAELLPDLIRVLGPDHPDTLTTRHRLATWQGKAGKVDGTSQSSI